MNYKKLRAISFFLMSMCFSIISYAEATWIDVRSAAEHSIDHIEGDVRITDTEIVQKMSQAFPDKDAEIHLYCRSGGRAGNAVSALKAAGYTNVSNAGGIDDARKERGISK